MHGIRAPSGFLPEPAQNTHSIAGSSISTSPVLLHTKQYEVAESKSKGSFPVPLQYAHKIIFFILTFNIV